MTWHTAVNFASTTVSSGALNNTTSPLTFSVATGAVFGSTFPIYAVVDPNGAPEVIEITARSTNSITATRPSAVAHAGAPKIICAPSAEYISELQTAADLKAPLASPALTGTPTAPTATSGTNTTQVATTAFVQSAVGAVTMDRAIIKSTSTQALTGGSWAKLNAGTVVVDSNSLTTTADQFTIATTGVYTATLWVGFAGATSCRLQIAISVNGAAYSNNSSVLVIASSKVSRDSSEYWATSCAGTASLTAGDVVYAYGYTSQNESTSNTGCVDAPHVYFSIVRTA